MNRILAASFVVAAFASVASANTLELQFLGTGKGRNIKEVLDGKAQDVFAGELRHFARNGTGLGASFNNLTLNTFCTEITQRVSSNWGAFTVTNPAWITPANPVIDRTQAVADMFALLTTKRASGLTNDAAAAFQIAVWELVYDFDAQTGRSSLDVTAGRFAAKNTNGSALSTAVMNEVNAFFNAIGSGARAGDVFGFANAGTQDQIVPTPGALALAGVGLLAIARRRRNA